MAEFPPPPVEGGAAPLCGNPSCGHLPSSHLPACWGAGGQCRCPRWEPDAQPPQPKKGTLGQVFFLPFERLIWDDSKHWGQVAPRRISDYMRAFREPTGMVAPFTLIKTGKVQPVDVIPAGDGLWTVRNGRHRVLAALACGHAGVFCRRFGAAEPPKPRRWWQRG